MINSNLAENITNDNEINFIPIWRKVSRDAMKLNHGSFKVLMHLTYKVHRYRNEKDKYCTSYESFKDLAEFCGVSPKTIREALAILEEKKFIKYKIFWIVNEYYKKEKKIIIELNFPRPSSASQEKIKTNGFLKIPVRYFEMADNLTLSQYKLYFYLVDKSGNKFNSITALNNFYGLMDTGIKSHNTLRAALEKFTEFNLISYDKGEFQTRKVCTYQLLTTCLKKETKENAEIVTERNDEQESIDTKKEIIDTEKELIDREMEATDNYNRIYTIERNNINNHNRSKIDDCFKFNFNHYQKQLYDVKRVLQRNELNPEEAELVMEYFRENPRAINPGGEQGPVIKSIPAVLESDLQSSLRIYWFRFREWKYQREKALRIEENRSLKRENGGFIFPFKSLIDNGRIINKVNEMNDNKCKKNFENVYWLLLKEVKVKTVVDQIIKNHRNIIEELLDRGHIVNMKNIMAKVKRK